jgi:hypothetical protein
LSCVFPTTDNSEEVPMGIRIAFTSTEALIARCDTAAAEASTGGPGLDCQAVVPVGEWRPLRAADAEPLRAADGDAPATVVELARIMPGVGQPLTGHDSPFTPLTSGYAAQFLAGADSPPGKPTTTINGSAGLRLGVHLDNFDRLPLSRRTASRRRLGVNLGPGVRHLLLGSIDILGICQAAGIYNLGHCPHTDDIRRHVAEGRPFRLLRLRLDPGDGYIAPTELVPHDGSTQTADAPSHIAFWLGHWPTGIVNSVI